MSDANPACPKGHRTRPFAGRLAGALFRPRLITAAVVAASCVLYLIVWVNYPLYILPRAGHDDGLFMTLGRNLAEGRWLGTYNRFTLMKGPGYPLFLAAGSWLGLPVSLMHGLFHCAAVCCFAWVLFRLTARRWLSLAVFTVTLWHPGIFLVARVSRDAIYPGQVLLVFAGLSYTLFVAGSRNRRILSALATGVLFGWFWLTREEGVWLLPGIGCLWLAAAIGSRHCRRPIVAHILVPAAVVIVGWGAVCTAFQWTNQVVYGQWVGVDIKEKNFRRAVAALQSVRGGGVTPYLPVPRAVRQRIYAVSPAFASLADYFDPPGGRTPWQSGCRYYPSTCGDIAGGWFLWALREGAAAKGHYRHPARASAFFGKIADEIAAACRDGRLTCANGFIAYMPAVTAAQIATVPRRLIQAVVLASFAPVRPRPDGPASDRTEDALAEALAFLNHPLHVPPANRSDRPSVRCRFDGWYYEKGARWFNLNVITGENTSGNFSLERRPSRDIAAHFGDRAALKQRFVIQADIRDDTVFVVSNGDNSACMRLKAQPILERLSRGGKFQNTIGDGVFFLDSGMAMGGASANRQVRASKTVRDGLVSVYRVGTPVLLAAGVAAFLWAGILAWRTRTLPALATLAATAWIWVATRIGVLILIDISSFPAIGFHYFSPIFTLTPICALLSVGALAGLLRYHRASSAPGTAAQTAGCGDTPCLSHEAKNHQMVASELKPVPPFK